MKKYIIGIILCLILFVASLATYRYKLLQIPKVAKENLTNDSLKQRNIIKNSVAKFFNDNNGGKGSVKLVRPLYHNFKSNYKKTDISLKRRIDSKNELGSLYVFSPNDRIESLETMSANIYYANVSCGKDNKALDGGQWKGIYESGWGIGMAENLDDSTYITYLIIPYCVGYVRQKDSYINTFAPSLDKALEEAYQFYTQNDKSQFKNFMSDGVVNPFFTLVNSPINLYNIKDDYSLFVFENVKNVKLDGHSLLINNESILFGGSQYIAGESYMYDNFIRVYITGTDFKVWKIKFDNYIKNEYISSYISHAKSQLKSQHSKIMFFLLVLLLVLILIAIISYKEKNRNLVSRLIALTNPKTFLKQYNKDKLDAANKLYAKAKDIDPNDENSVLNLCDEIELTLDKTIITKDEISILKKKSNPKNFMKPYDAEKVAKANEIYAEVKNKKLTYRKYIALKNSTEELYQ